MKVEEAAKFLDIGVRVLRKMIGRHAFRNGELTEARFDGIFARKLGNRWRVQLGPWATDAEGGDR